MSSVFVSYSRRDRDAVAAIVTGLRAADEEVWVDLDEIVPSTVWMEEIKTAIANADSVIFFISPDSVTSQVCGGPRAGPGQRPGLRLSGPPRLRLGGPARLGGRSRLRLGGRSRLRPRRPLAQPGPGQRG